ncbi:hypothetical protein [Enterobacter soli]|uniref:hypothetical protein n=1 Tax=Enterobacter soli TaxID=885040 RepID=UPI0034CEB069
MNKIELSKKLESEKISKSLYSLDGGLPNEKLCLDYYNEKWMVYYSERGCRTGLTEFIHEDDACLFIYDKIKLISTGKVR